MQNGSINSIDTGEVHCCSETCHVLFFIGKAAAGADRTRDE